MPSSHFSSPNSNALTQTQLLATQRCFQRIANVIEQKGHIGFDEYMQFALHDPEVGYYQRQDDIFGEEGDFITVPETSVHLAFCLAHASAKLIYDDNERTILEMGAGSGKLACNILSFLSTWKILPSRYYIYEPSQSLQTKQQKLLEQELPEYVENVRWLSNLDCEIETAIVIANEVLDVLPVHCFQVQAQSIDERCVTLNKNGNFGWCLRQPSEKLDAALDYITVMLNEPLAEGYQSEINLKLKSTLSTWAHCCDQCVMFLIDYGSPCKEYYHPQRNMGTLRCYFKHQVSEDVFTYPGLQDITADVDFSAVARIAEYLQLGVLSFGSQRNFMLANHLLEWQPTASTEVERLTQIAQLKQFTLGSAISERFQVMVLGKGVDYGADRFTVRDMRARL